MYHGIGKRIAMIRKEVKVTQQEFANRVGCTRSAVANYEVGINEPIDMVIRSICREFGVSESWLRTGEGSMFLPQTQEEEMSRLFGRMVKNRDTDRERLVAMLLKLSDEEIAWVKERVLEIADSFREGDDG